MEGEDISRADYSVQFPLTKHTRVQFQCTVQSSPVTVSHTRNIIIINRTRHCRRSGRPCRPFEASSRAKDEMRLWVDGRVEEEGREVVSPQATSSSTTTTTNNYRLVPDTLGPVAGAGASKHECFVEMRNLVFQKFSVLIKLLVPGTDHHHHPPLHRWPELLLLDGPHI